MATTRKVSASAKSRKASAKFGKQAAKPQARKSSKKSAQKAAKKSLKAAKPQKSAKPRKAAKSPKAMRLTFSYEGDDVKLLSQQPVEMTVPPSDAIGYGGQKGFWAELMSDKNKTLYRHVMHNPTRNDAEVFSPDPAIGVSRAPAPKRTGVFTVVVPDKGKGHSVRLCRSPVKKSEQTALPKAERGVRSLAGAPAEEFARYKLK